MKRVLALLTAAATIACAAVADDRDTVARGIVENLPGYAPAERVAGTIRIWGHGSFKRPFMAQLMRRWAAEFAAFHPAVRFENKMYGTASAIGALATGAGDIALLGEEISPASERTFRRAKGYAPTEIQVATGSLDVNFFDYAHMIFVHADNPLAGLSLPQLERIFAAEPRSGRTLRRWGDLGLTGEWADQPIRLHSWKVDEDFALFFRERVLHHSHRWNERVQEYVHQPRADGTQYDHGQQIVDAVARDRYAIGLSNVRYATPGVKALPLTWRDGAEAVPATNATLVEQTYPLVRIIPAFVDRAPGEPLAPPVREFLRYVLSRQGQRALIDETGYLPLGANARAAQLEKLK